MTRVILASGSAIRRQILEDAGVAFEVQTSGIDENAIKAEWTGKNPSGLAVKLAEAKAKVVQAGEETLVLGADQILGRRMKQGRGCRRCAAKPISSIRGWWRSARVKPSGLIPRTAI